MDSREELDNHLRVSPGEIKRGKVELDPQESPGEIKSREVEMDSESWTAFCFSCCSTVVLRTSSL